MAVARRSVRSAFCCHWCPDQGLVTQREVALASAQCHGQRGSWPWHFSRCPSCMWAAGLDLGFMRHEVETWALCFCTVAAVFAGCGGDSEGDTRGHPSCPHQWDRQGAGGCWAVTRGRIRLWMLRFSLWKSPSPSLAIDSPLSPFYFSLKLGTVMIPVW